LCPRAVTHPPQSSSIKEIIVDHHYPEPPDPETANVVATLTREVRSIVDNDGTPEAKGGAPIDRDPAKLFAIGAALCDSGDFHNALPIALHLASRPNVHPQHAFLAASCLQRLRRPELAAPAFGFCTLLEGNAPTPGPLFRAGECYSAIGLVEQAVQMLETAIELARTDARHAAIQSLAQTKLDAIRAVR
jgi:tetratricopeptide (TPR) repeat protein